MCSSAPSLRSLLPPLCVLLCLLPVFSSASSMCYSLTPPCVLLCLLPVFSSASSLCSPLPPPCVILSPLLVFSSAPSLCALSQIMSYATCLVNGVFWNPGSARLITNEQGLSLHPPSFDSANLIHEGMPKLPQRLLAIADISIDLNVNKQNAVYTPVECAPHTLVLVCITHSNPSLHHMF